MILFKKIKVTEAISKEAMRADAKFSLDMSKYLAKTFLFGIMVLVLVSLFKFKPSDLNLINVFGVIFALMLMKVFGTYFSIEAKNKAIEILNKIDDD